MILQQTMPKKGRGTCRWGLDVGLSNFTLKATDYGASADWSTGCLGVRRSNLVIENVTGMTMD